MTWPHYLARLSQLCVLQTHTHTHHAMTPFSAPLRHAASSVHARALHTLISAVNATLSAAHIPDAASNAHHIACAAMGLDGPDGVARALGVGAVASSAQHARAHALAHRRAAREPLQFCLGDWDFDTLRGLQMRAPVLIPRPETETLVALAAACVRRLLADTPSGPVRVLDVGCGSGAISLALLARVADPRLRVTAIDCSADAVALTAANAERVGAHATDRLRVIHVDFAAFDCAADAPFDLLVSNPPYIPDSDLALLEPEVRDWEDRRALAGGPNEGLDVIVRLLLRAAATAAATTATTVSGGNGSGPWVRPGGHILLETHSTHPAMLAAALGEASDAVLPFSGSLSYEVSLLPPPMGLGDGRDDDDGYFRTRQPLQQYAPIPLSTRVEAAAPPPAPLFVEESAADAGEVAAVPTAIVTWRPETPEIASRVTAALTVLQPELQGLRVAWMLRAGWADCAGRPRFVHLTPRPRGGGSLS